MSDLFSHAFEVGHLQEKLLLFCTDYAFCFAELAPGFDAEALDFRLTSLYRCFYFCLLFVKPSYLGRSLETDFLNSSSSSL
jgi:hypothetical protein